MSPVSGARPSCFPSSGLIVFSSASRREFFERGELVLLASRFAVELLRGLVKLEAPVGCRLGAAFAKRLHLVFSVRLEAARDPEVLAQNLERVHAADGRGDRKTHRVAQRLFRLDDTLF